MLSEREHISPGEDLHIPALLQFIQLTNTLQPPTNLELKARRTSTASSSVIMELNPYNPINTLDTSTYEWKCCVRVQSFWKGMNRESQEFWGVNMILIDDSNSRIHAFANSKYCDDLLKDMKEGQIYEICNFKVKDYLVDEKFRAVRNKKHLFFTPHTKFQQADTIGLSIEKYAFDLFHYDEIDKLADDNRFLIDMVGKVKNVQELIKIKKNEDEKMLFKFEITNGRSSVQVTFFDYFGEQLETEFGKLDGTSIFVIISCAKVGRYEGVAHLSNYPATRVFINPEHYNVDRLKKSLTEEKKKIKNLPKDFEEGIIYCEVTVKRFMDKSSWYFRKCTGCDLELEVQDAKFKCLRDGGCGRIYPYPEKRFRVGTLCSDETGSITIIFPDNEITRMIDKTVIDMHAECADEAEEEKFPEILNFLLK
ncbi:hypothetical protein ACET3Z_000656 [Daucus carota]